MKIQGPTQSLFDQATEPGAICPHQPGTRGYVYHEYARFNVDGPGRDLDREQGDAQPDCQRLGFGGQEGSGQLHHSLSRGGGD